jgi:glucose-1-phosphate cytidylyltransferase
MNIKAVILAGGLGTRLAEETQLKPKPMVEIGGRPILWHIMKLYSYHGINDFVICCGYKGYLIKEYFSNYYLHSSDITFDMPQNRMEVHHQHCEPWRVTLVDTGERTMTGGRLKRIADYVRQDDFFCMTYGDGLSDVNINETINFHLNHGKQATVTAVYPPSRYGVLEFDGDLVRSFKEKPESDRAMINGGFFVLSPTVLDLIPNDETIWEREPLEQLVESQQVFGYKHSGFWQSMDTLREKILLDELWSTNNAPWKKWQ